MVQVGVDVTVVVTVLVLVISLKRHSRFVVQGMNSTMDVLWKGTERINPGFVTRLLAALATAQPGARHVAG